MSENNGRERSQCKVSRRILTEAWKEKTKQSDTFSKHANKEKINDRNEMRESKTR